MKKLILVIPIVLVIVILFLLLGGKNNVPVINNEIDNGATNREREAIFHKSEAWGPCPLQAEPCELETTVYSNGEYQIEGQSVSTGTLPVNTIEQFQKYINESKVMTMSCTSEDVLDYFAKYTIYNNGLSKEVVFPGCQKVMREIESILQIPDVEIKGCA